MYAFSKFSVMVEDVKLCISTGTDQSVFCLSFKSSDGITIPLY